MFHAMVFDHIVNDTERVEKKWQNMALGGGSSKNTIS